MSNTRKWLASAALVSTVLWIIISVVFLLEKYPEITPFFFLGLIFLAFTTLIRFTIFGNDYDKRA